MSHRRVLEAHLENILINSQHPKAATKNTRKGARMWAAKVALLALAIQVLMPISQGLAASNSISGGMLEFCTQFGIQLRSVDVDADLVGPPTAPSTTPSTTKASLDCPICLLQIGADTAKPQIFAFMADGLKQNNIEPAPSVLLAETYYKGPNPPRAPPAT